MAQAEHVEPDPLWDDALNMSGPSSPQSAPFVDVTGEEPWPLTEVVATPSVCIMGLHGGAGASLIAGLIGQGAYDTQRAWPIFTGWARPEPTLPVVAVARTSYSGVDAAGRLARLWAGGALPSSSRLLGIVLIDDGPKLTTQQKNVVKRLAQMVPNGWHLPWMETWRLEKPTYDGSPARVRRIIDQIRSLAQQ